MPRQRGQMTGSKESNLRSRLRATAKLEMGVVMTETVRELAMVAGHETETETTIDGAGTAGLAISARHEASEIHLMLEHLEAMPAATRVGGEAEAEMMTDVTHAATETATTTEAGEGAGPAPDLARHIATIVLVTIATVGTVGTALIATTTAETAMTVAIPVARTATPIRPR